MWRGIDKFDLVGNDVILESFDDGVKQARFKIENKLIVKPIHIEVSLHLGLGIDKRGITAFANFQSGNLVRNLAVDKLHTVVAQNGEATSEREVNQGNGLGQRAVLGVRIAVVLGDLFAGDIDKLRALLTEIIVK